MTIAIRAITVHQPWASLLVCGLKSWEFRSWPLPKSLVGRPIAIHAAARPVRACEIHELLARIAIRAPVGVAADAVQPLTDLAAAVENGAQPWPLAAVVGLVRFGSARKDEALGRALDSPLFPLRLVLGTNWGWPVRAWQDLAPRPTRGAQRIWWYEAPRDDALIAALSAVSAPHRVPGMAHFAATGPIGSICLECAHAASGDDRHWFRRGRKIACKISRSVRGEFVAFTNDQQACRSFQRREA